MAIITKPSFPFRRFGLALLIGAAGGTAFYGIGMPLPFMLGSMVACIVAAILRLPVIAPISVRPPMSAIIGAMIGASFTPELLNHLPSMLWSILMLLAFTIFSGLVSVAYFHRIIGYDFRTAYFAGMPGGLIEMVMLADEHHGDPRKVAIVHTLRVMVVVFTVPFFVLSMTGAERVTGFDTSVSINEVDLGFVFWFLLSGVVGIALGNLLRLPARYFVGPMLVSGAVHLIGWSDYKLPFEMVIVAQIVLGATIGCRFVGTTVKEITSVAVAAIGSTVILLVITALFAVLVETMTEFSFLTIFLAYSPGGLAEISLLALALQIETAVVTAHHIVRIVAVGFGAPLIFLLGRRFFGWRER